MNSKLFKKLNEQMEVNQITNAPITEAEQNAVEQELIFGDLTESITENINLCEFSNAKGKSGKTWNYMGGYHYSFEETKDKDGNVTSRAVTRYNKARNTYGKSYPVPAEFGGTAEEAYAQFGRKKK